MIGLAAEHLERLERLDHLHDELQRADALQPKLFARVMSEACTRISLLREARSGGRIDRLIEAGAWTDAALALLELELPAWKLRRLVRADSEWLCSLSRQIAVPEAFDDGIDASHAILPLAILSAFVQARRSAALMPQPASAVPRVMPTPKAAICCDNFA